MTAHLVGEQEVEILGVVGPAQLAVRPLSFASHYDRLQKQLQKISGQLKKLSQPNVNQSCAVSYEKSWHRGLVEVIEGETCRVKLVDLGRRRNVNVDTLKELPDCLLQEHAYCAFCHLPGCSDVDKKILEAEVESLKMVVQTVSLHRRGVPEMKDGVWSLPVEICWDEPKYDNPVGPPAQQQVFLSQRIHMLRVQGESTLDTTKSEEESLSGGKL